jgi:ion channel-forming bestrophin family protein
MIIKSNWSLLDLITRTWRINLFILLIVTGSSFLEIYVISAYYKVPANLSTILGTAIAFFIGFMNNQSYGRWWEARQIWGGLVNDSRSWARFLKAYATDAERLTERMVQRHIAFVYALNTALRKNNLKYYRQYLTQEDQSAVDPLMNIPNGILSLQARDLQQLSEQQSVDSFRFLQLSQLLEKFCDHMGKSERIKNTIFPTTYVYFTQISIFIFGVVNTMVLTDLIGYWAIFWGWLIDFIFYSTFINGLYIMNPFENQPSDIPLDSISRTIEINLLQELGYPETPPPVQPVNDEYLM